MPRAATAASVVHILSQWGPLQNLQVVDAFGSQFLLRGLFGRDAGVGWLAYPANKIFDELVGGVSGVEIETVVGRVLPKTTNASMRSEKGGLPPCFKCNWTK